MTTTEAAIREPHKKTVSVENFLQRAAPKTEAFNVPELGGDVVVRGITLRERESIISGARDVGTDKIDNAAFAALTLVFGVVEPKLTVAHVAQLKEANVGIVTRISDRIWELSGVKKGAPGVEAAKNA